MLYIYCPSKKAKMVVVCHMVNEYSACLKLEGFVADIPSSRMWYQ